jgi:hypothetical protein
MLGNFQGKMGQLMLTKETNSPFLCVPINWSSIALIWSEADILPVRNGQNLKQDETVRALAR